MENPKTPVDSHEILISLIVNVYSKFLLEKKILQENGLSLTMDFHVVFDKTND